MPDVDRPADGPTPDDLAELRKLHEAAPGPCAGCGADPRVCAHLVSSKGMAGCCGPCGVGETHGRQPVPRVSDDECPSEDVVRQWADDERDSCTLACHVLDVLAYVERLRARITDLQELAGQHDPTGQDHMAEMWEHAQRADTAEAEVERLRQALADRQIVLDQNRAYWAEIERLRSNGTAAHAEEEPA